MTSAILIFDLYLINNPIWVTQTQRHPSLRPPATSPPSLHHASFHQQRDALCNIISPIVLIFSISMKTFDKHESKVPSPTSSQKSKFEKAEFTVTPTQGPPITYMREYDALMVKKS